MVATESSRLEDKDDARDDRQNANPASYSDSLAEEHLPDECDQHVTQAVERHDLGEVMAAIEVQAHDQRDQKERAPGPEPPLPTEPPELASGGGASKREAADLNKRCTDQI